MIQKLVRTCADLAARSNLVESYQRFYTIKGLPRLITGCNGSVTVQTFITTVCPHMGPHLEMGIEIVPLSGVFSFR